MDAVNLAEYFFKNLRQREQNNVDIIAAGNVRSMEDYKYLMGELSAYRSPYRRFKRNAAYGR